MKRKDELIQAKRLKQEIELSSVLEEQDEYFCQLYLNGGSDFQGKPLACYKKAFPELSEGVNQSDLNIQAVQYLNKSEIGERIKELYELTDSDQTKAAMKIYMVENLKKIIDETANSVYQNRYGLDMSPAPLRAVAVNAIKALGDLYPTVKPQREEEHTGGNVNNGFIFNIVVPDGGRKEKED